MRWTARVGENLHEVEWSRADRGVVTASVDGRVYALSVTEPQPSVYSILSDDGASIEAVVQVKQGKCRVRLGARIFEVLAEEPARFDLKGAAGASGSAGRLAVRSVMPGRVLRVLVSPGETVAAKQGLVVVEAMKMENEVVAPRDGTVASVEVAPGRTVETGDLLVVIE